MSYRFRFLSVLVMMVFSRFVVAGTVWLNWGTDKEPVSYGTNEPMRFWVQLVEDGSPLAGKTLKWKRFGDDRQEATGEVVTSADGRGEVVSSIGVPGFVVAKGSYLNI